MRVTTLILPALFLGITACSGSKDNQAQQTDEQMKANGVPSASEVNAAQAAGNSDTGGKLTADITGGKSAHTDINDLGFCVMKTAGMEIFALSGNNKDWSVSIMGKTGLPTTGTFAIVDMSDPKGYSASVSDKSTGSEPATWQRYQATGGSVTFTKATPEAVEGTFTVKVIPEGPRKTGPALDLTGNFASPKAQACE